MRGTDEHARARFLSSISEFIDGDARDATRGDDDDDARARDDHRRSRWRRDADVVDGATMVERVDGLFKQDHGGADGVRQG